MNLKVLRKNLNKTQEQVADGLGIKKQNYQNYERGIRKPDIDMVIHLADYFDVSLDFLLERPRPYDLPSTATLVQRELVKVVLELSDDDCEMVDTYIAGMLAGKEYQQKVIRKINKK